MGDLRVRTFGGGSGSSIGVRSLENAVITLASGSFTYDGTVKTQNVASVVLDGVTLVENTDYVVLNNSASEAGTHTLSVLGILAYGGVATKNWSIAKLSLTKPTVSGSYTYNGSAQSVSLSNFNSSRETKGGTTSATNAGSYTATVSLKDTANTQWADGSTGAISLPWTINKAAGSISTSPSSLEIVGAAGTTKTATITKTGNGAVSASSSNTGVATASVSGSTVTVTSQTIISGSATITLTLAESSNYTGASCTLKVTALGASTTLNDNDWATIAAVSAAGQAASFWKVGDTKTETLNGTSYTFRIAGFDHDDLNSSDAKYSDSSYNGGKKKAGITFEMVEIFNTTYYMNSSDTNSGGWDSSYMRKTVMQTMKGYMSSALKNALRTVSKLASAGSASSTIKTSADELFLLSEVEVKGTANYSYAGEGTQYAYYKAGNSAIKKKSGNAYYWWLRSPRSSSTNVFVGVYSDGSLNNSIASGSYGVAFGFCI